MNHYIQQATAESSTNKKCMTPGLSLSVASVRETSCHGSVGLSAGENGAHVGMLTCQLILCSSTETSFSARTPLAPPGLTASISSLDPISLWLTTSRRQLPLFQKIGYAQKIGYTSWSKRRKEGEWGRKRRGERRRRNRYFTEENIQTPDKHMRNCMTSYKLKFYTRVEAAMPYHHTPE